MKSMLKNTLFGIMCVSAACLVACGGTTSSSAASSSDPNAPVQEFVAVTSTEWNAAQSVSETLADESTDNWTYYLSVTLNADNTATFKADCTAYEWKEKQQGGGGCNCAVVTGEGETSEAAAEHTKTQAEIDARDFTIAGTWELETGYGYKLSIDGKTIHTDYITDEGRHQFYGTFSQDAVSFSGIKYQAKDSAFRKTLASDYKTWDERDSKYIFSGHVTGNNSSVATAYMYFHSDGSVIYNTANGSDRSVSELGTWAEANDVITLTVGCQSYSSTKTLSGAANPGYRLIYSGTAYYCSTSSTAWYDMTTEDFDGATQYGFTGTYNDTNNVNLNLTTIGAFVYTNGSLTSSGTWAFEADVFTVTLDGTPYVSTKDGNTYHIAYQVSVAGMCGSTIYDVDLTYGA